MLIAAETSRQIDLAHMLWTYMLWAIAIGVPLALVIGILYKITELFMATDQRGSGFVAHEITDVFESDDPQAAMSALPTYERGLVAHAVRRLERHYRYRIAGFLALVGAGLILNSLGFLPWWVGLPASLIAIALAIAHFAYWTDWIERRWQLHRWSQ